MVGTLDFNNDDVLRILDNPNYTDSQKKSLFEKYKTDLKDARRKEIINRLNECAKNNPIVTQEEYINFLKQYNGDDLTKPFDVIEEEIEAFNSKMNRKYEEYLRDQEEKKKIEEELQNETKVEEEPEENESEEDFDIDDIKPDVTPVSYNDLDNTLFSKPIEEKDDSLEPTVFEDKRVKEKNPEELAGSLDEKGNASAIIISIIAIIVGMVIMYSIIKLK